MINDKIAGTSGNIPDQINLVTPAAKSGAATITRLVKQSGRVTGYELSNGKTVLKDEAVSMAKSGEIRGVGVATRKGSEYLRSLPDDKENNNLSNLPSISM